jgi:FkbM family methyltransferase
MDDFPPEIFCTSHGLETSDLRIKDYVRNRAALDIGAYNGDSALVLMDYVKDVYSFEPGIENFRKMLTILANNTDRFGKTHPFNIALSDFVGRHAFHDEPGSQARFGKGDPGEIQVPVTTIDAFMKDSNVKIGFVKCDTEGHGLPIIRGAENTLKKHRPVLSLAVYHNFDEFFGLLPLLKQFLPDYVFEWEFQTNWISKWHEMILRGYPPEVYNSGRRHGYSRLNVY